MTRFLSLHSLSAMSPHRQNIFSQALSAEGHVTTNHDSFFMPRHARTLTVEEVSLRRTPCGLFFSSDRADLFCYWQYGIFLSPVWSMLCANSFCWQIVYAPSVMCSMWWKLASNDSRVWWARARASEQLGLTYHCAAAAVIIKLLSGGSLHCLVCWPFFPCYKAW